MFDGYGAREYHLAPVTFPMGEGVRSIAAKVDPVEKKR